MYLGCMLKSINQTVTYQKAKIEPTAIAAAETVRKSPLVALTCMALMSPFC